MFKRKIAIILSALFMFSGFWVSASTASASASASGVSKTIPVSVQGNYLCVEAQARNFSEGMIGIYDQERDKSGFIDIDGNETIACEYNYVNEFHEGLAYASLTPYVGGYIDYSGQFIIPPVYSWGNDFREGKAIVCMQDTFCQIINTKGEHLLPQEAKSIRYDELLDRYVVLTQSGNTDILKDDLTLEKTLPASIEYFYKSGDKILAAYHKDDYSKTGVMDYDTGKIIASQEEYTAISIINDFIISNSEKDQQVCIYDLDGKLLQEFESIGYVYPISENMFHYYDNETGLNFIRENGKDRPVDYSISQAVLPGLLSALYVGAEQAHYGVINTKGETVLPAKYDYIFTNYYEYGYGSEKNSNTFMAMTSDTCEIYDGDCKLIRTFDDVINVGYGYVTDKKGVTTILDEAGKDVAVIDTGGGGVVGKTGDLLFTNKDEKNVTYINIQNGVSQKGQYSYSPVKMDDPSLNAEKEVAFFTAFGVKRNVNGVMILQEEWFPKSVIEKNRILVYPYYLNVIANQIGQMERDTASTVYSAAKSLQMPFGSKTAELSGFDYNTGKLFKTNVSLEVPAQKIKAQINGYDDSVSFIPLRAACEALGYHVYWNDGLIGISNKPITISEREASDLKTALTSNLFAPQQFKRLDASLATQPYVDALIKKTLGVDEIYYNPSEYTNTIPGYEALINKEKDIILVTEPSKEMLELAASKGVELEITPFAKEGFVFLLNESNPVDTLTVQQLKDIYSGKTTDWKEVGGSDAPIIAYQRNQSSGSQTIMENVFMKDEKLMEPIVERRIMSMEGLIDVISEFKGDVNNSIGYSVYYYATQMYGNDQVKLVKVDGITPNTDTIKDDTYPVVVNYYIVTRKGDKSQFTSELKDYILSPEGQKLLEDVGLVPVGG